MMDDMGLDMHMIEMSDQKDLIPKAMKPSEFDKMEDEHHLD